MSWEILQRQRRKFRMYDDEEFLHMLNIIATMEEEEEAPHRGSVFGHRVIHRDRNSGYFRLMMDYFSESPVYGDEVFRRWWAIHEACVLCKSFFCLIEIIWSIFLL